MASQIAIYDLKVASIDNPPSPTLIGQKATDLMSLPHPWWPNSIAVSTELVETLNPQASIHDVASAFRSALNGTRFSDFIAECKACGPRVIVRSSASAEGLFTRGLLRSKPCASSNDIVYQTLAELLRDNTSADPDRTAGKLAFIIQPLLQIRASGHLSNERRVSRNKTKWLLESERDGVFSSHRLSTQGSPTADPATALHAGPDRTLKQAQLSLAAYFVDPGCRFHFEWVWDGKSLWIVQCDRETRTDQSAPGHNFQASVMSPHYLPVALKTLDRCTSAWPKIECVRTFIRCNLPAGNVYVLDDPDIIRRLIDRAPCSVLESELRWLCEQPVVIRSDVSSSLGRRPLLLPRTDSIRSSAEATSFLTNTAVKFHEEGLKAEDFCFIIHRFIWASGAAHAMAWPDRPSVMIDSTWGLPEGLNYFPHDTFVVDVAARKHTMTLRGKTTYLDVRSDGKWLQRAAGWNWDWKQSLTSKQAHEIAVETKRLADYVGKPVDVMYFVNVDSVTGHPPILPWHFTTDSIRELALERAEYRFAGDRVYARDIPDLARVRQKIAEGRKFSVRLQPCESRVRDDKFLDEVAKLCKTNEIAVELEGSILSHAYYVLCRGGVHVRCVELATGEAEPQQFGKLVRDNIPVRIMSHGELPRVARFAKDDLMEALKRKVIEEAVELLQATDPLGTMEELADLLELVRTIATMDGAALQDVIEIADQKRDERGGFTEGFYLIETESAPLFRRSADKTLFDGKENQPVLGTVEKVVHGDAFGDHGIHVDNEKIVISVLAAIQHLEHAKRIVEIPQGAGVLTIHGRGGEVFMKFEQQVVRPRNPNQLELPFE